MAMFLIVLIYLGVENCERDKVNNSYPSHLLILNPHLPVLREWVWAKNKLIITITIFRDYMTVKG